MLPSPTSPAQATAAPSRSSPVQPSVPQTSLGTAAAQSNNLVLSADRSSLRSGESVLLRATATTSVTGTPTAIEIFDQTTGTLAGACMQSSRCMVGYSAPAGVHSFSAFITPPDAKAPATGPTIRSNAVQASWLGVSVTASAPSVVGPGKPVTLTASSTLEVRSLGSVLMFWDNTAGKRLTFCGNGTSCSTTVNASVAGAHEVVVYVAKTANDAPPAAVNNAKDYAYPTWLSVYLEATTTDPVVGGLVNITATANADLTNTPWSLGILDHNGKLVDKPCKSGSTCHARVTLAGGQPPTFSAVIGAPSAPVNATTTAGQLLINVAARAPLLNIQARSSVVQPSRTLWGVDSCKPITGDATGASGLYPQVDAYLGKPDFWGRYLTTTYNCPGLSADEVAAAAHHQMGILPIYNDYDCSAVAGYFTGTGYAANAVAAAVSLGIPKGTVLVIDIEPPGPYCSGGIDAPFIVGWHDAILAGNYSPGYYGDMTYGSTFETAWCNAVSEIKNTVTGSYLWSFEPSLLGGYTKRSAPGFAPNHVGCVGNVFAWQYELSSGATPDVDHDQALSQMPLWYP